MALVPGSYQDIFGNSAGYHQALNMQQQAMMNQYNALQNIGLGSINQASLYTQTQQAQAAKPYYHELERFVKEQEQVRLAKECSKLAYDFNTDSFIRADGSKITSEALKAAGFNSHKLGIAPKNVKAGDLVGVNKETSNIAWLDNRVREVSIRL